MRLKAAKRLKLKTVPVIIYDNITEAEERDIILRDNVNNGDWNIDDLLCHCPRLPSALAQRAILRIGLMTQQR